MPPQRDAEREQRSAGDARAGFGEQCFHVRLGVGYFFVTARTSRERRDHTLAPTELVHEAWLKVRGNASARTPVGLAATAMRAALVDHARRRAAGKRGLGVRAEPLDLEHAAYERDAYVVALDEALVDLAAVDPELARLVELRFFGALELDALAQALGLSARTTKRRWLLAKAWLHQRVGTA